MTVIAFSVAKPFRKPIWTNLPFLISIIFIIYMNTVFLFSPNPGTPPCDFNDSGVEICLNTPGRNFLVNFFIIEPFYYEGKSYYNYRFFIFGGVVLNIIVTLAFEKLFIAKLTKNCDRRGRVKIQTDFSTLMEKAII
jgi:hypothetical protein